MKAIVFFLISFCSITGFSQVDYQFFYETDWGRCLPKNKDQQTDTIVFFNRSHKSYNDSCKTNWYSKTHISNDNLHYTFYENDSMGLYKDGGSMVRRDYVPDTSISTITQYDTIYNDQKEILDITTTVTEVKIPIQYGWGGSAAVFSTSTYSLKRNKNKLTVIDNIWTKNYEPTKIKYKVLFLSKNRMILRRKN